MRRLIIFTLCLLAFSQAKAQFSVEYQAGFGTYDMGDMKEALRGLQQNWMSDENAKYTDNFPGGLTHNVNIGYRLNKGTPKRNVFEVSDIYEIGLKCSFYSTKGNFYDLRAPATANNQFSLSAYRQGIYFRDYFYNRKPGDYIKLSVFFEISPAIIFSKIKQEGSTNVKYNKSFSNKSFSILGQFGIRYNITPQVGINAAAGYEFSPGTNNYTESFNYANVDPNDQWSGIRISAGVSYVFTK